MSTELLALSILALIGISAVGYKAISFVGRRRVNHDLPTSADIKSPRPLRFNIAQVSINEHKAIFEEVILALEGAFSDLNMPCTRTENEFPDDAINIVIGSVIFVSEPLVDILAGKSYIVYQMEQLTDDRGFPAYLDVLKNALTVWDYSSKNIVQLASMGVPVSAHVPVGFHKSLEVISNDVNKDIDVLFYGSMSPRREAILNQLKAQGVNVLALFGLYGQERAAMIARAKIVLNIHGGEINTLEEVRLSYLLTNRCFVISENSDHNPYGDGVIFAPYDELVQKCLQYLNGSEAARHQIAGQGYRAICKLDFTSGVAKAIVQVTGILRARQLLASSSA